MTIEISKELNARAGDYAKRKVRWFAENPKHDSAKLSWGGAEKKEVIWRDARMAECAVCMAFGLDVEILNWKAGPDGGWDVEIPHSSGNKTLVDVKETKTRYLFWPVNKNKIFDTAAQFHVFVSATASDLSVALHGWISKAQFRRRRKIADENGPLAIGTRYIERDLLHRMGVFPGRSDDPREHYCWCGEWGSRGTPQGWFCAEHSPTFPLLEKSPPIAKAQALPDMTLDQVQAELRLGRANAERKRALWATVDQLTKGA